MINLYCDMKKYKIFINYTTLLKNGYPSIILYDSVCIISNNAQTEHYQINFQNKNIRIQYFRY